MEGRQQTKSRHVLGSSCAAGAQHRADAGWPNPRLSAADQVLQYRNPRAWEGTPAASELRGSSHGARARGREHCARLADAFQPGNDGQRHRNAPRCSVLVAAPRQPKRHDRKEALLVAPHLQEAGAVCGHLQRWGRAGSVASLSRAGLAGAVTRVRARSACGGGDGSQRCDARGLRPLGSGLLELHERLTCRRPWSYSSPSSAGVALSRGQINYEPFSPAPTRASKMAPRLGAEKAGAGRRRLRAARGVPEGP